MSSLSAGGIKKEVSVTSMKKPITDEDLLGLVEVRLLRIVESKSMPDTKVFTVEYGGRTYRVGVIGKDAYEAVKKHGYKTEDGTVILRIPRTVLRDEGAGWITASY
ncbi:MAG: hypothetical protein QXL27_09725 [Candidatus Bathyarchaeia archaeon]